MPSQNEIRKQLTDQIITALEQDILPWRKTWISTTNSGRAANVASQKPYRGMNPLLLEIHAQQHGFRSKWWGTYLQWQQLGCQVQKRPNGVPQGRWGSQILFFKPITKTVVKNGLEEEESFRLLNIYTVFNADQVNGSERFQVGEEPIGTTEPSFQPAEDLIANSEAEIRYGGDRAFYSPSGDYIQMPPKSSFVSEGAFYETIFHELGHWSELRLDWHGSYEQGELVAEMAACYLSTELGIPQERLENHAAYLKSWLQSMRGDTNWIFKASTQASKVADYLLAFASQEVPMNDLELVPF